MRDSKTFFMLNSDENEIYSALDGSYIEAASREDLSSGFPTRSDASRTEQPHMMAEA